MLVLEGENKEMECKDGCVNIQEKEMLVRYGEKIIKTIQT